VEFTCTRPLNLCNFQTTRSIDDRVPRSVRLAWSVISRATSYPQRILLSQRATGVSVTAKWATVRLQRASGRRKRQASRRGSTSAVTSRSGKLDGKRSMWSYPHEETTGKIPWQLMNLASSSSSSSSVQGRQTIASGGALLWLAWHGYQSRLDWGKTKLVGVGEPGRL